MTVWLQLLGCAAHTAPAVAAPERALEIELAVYEDRIARAIEWAKYMDDGFEAHTLVSSRVLAAVAAEHLGLRARAVEHKARILDGYAIDLCAAGGSWPAMSEADHALFRAIPGDNDQWPSFESAIAACERQEARAGAVTP